MLGHGPRGRNLALLQFSGRKRRAWREVLVSSATDPRRERAGKKSGRIYNLPFCHVSQQWGGSERCVARAPLGVHLIELDVS